MLDGGGWVEKLVSGGDGGFGDGYMEVKFALVKEGCGDECGRRWLDGVWFWAWSV